MLPEVITKEGHFVSIEGGWQLKVVARKETHELGVQYSTGHWVRLMSGTITDCKKELLALINESNIKAYPMPPQTLEESPFGKEDKNEG